MSFISGNYKNPLEFDESLLIANDKAIQRLKKTINLKSADNINELNSDNFVNKFHSSMQLDLNTSMALGSIFEMAKAINQSHLKKINIKNSQKDLERLLNILGINIHSDDDLNSKNDSQEIINLVNLRNQFRKEKQYDKADEIRDKLLSKGITIYDSSDGTTKWSSE